MGKGTKKKTVWRTFSFENGYTNDTDDGDTNGLTAHHYQKDGLDNSQDVSNRTAISNGKYVSSWRSQQPRYNKYDVAIDENDATNTKFLHSNGNDYTENGHRGEFYKRTPLADGYPVRGNGIRKVDTHFHENGDGNQIDFHDIHENQTMKSSQFRSNRSMKVPVSRHVSHKKWDNRNGNYNSNGILSNYSRGNFRKSLNSDREAANENNLTDEHFNENGLVKNVRNADDSDKCQDNVNDCNSAQQQRSNQHFSRQLNKFNEDEYTRISTPRSEVLFKKGYLMRDKKYAGPTNTISTTATSSNDSGSVSVVSNEETASYYSIQSMSPDNSTYNNGNNSSDSNSASYPNDGFEHDLSLMYSSGFYDNNGYFYVNPYIQNNFDQFVGPTILMPYGSAPTTEDLDTYDAAFPAEPLSPITVNTKSIDGEHVKKCNSINSEDMSNSSLSENVSINNDSDTPQTPLTPPPSPLSPNEKPIARSESSENEATQNIDVDKSITDEIINENGNEQKTDTQIELDGEKIIETLPNDEKDEKDEELPETEGVASVSDNYSMPYFSPFIYVPPMPFVPDARMSGTRRGKFRHHVNNYFGRPKRNNRFSRFYNKVYIPTSWSEAPDELAQINVTDEEVVEPKLGDENAVEIAAPTPTIEQCDKILQNSKLNLNVSEFIPQNKRIIFVPLPITPSPPPASVYFVPIPSTESTLNVNVPEFLPKNYKPLNAEIDAINDNDEQKPASTVNNGTEMLTIKTNESIENQNETTNHNNNNKNNHTNGLSSNTKCMQTIAPDNQQHKLYDCVHNAKCENKQIGTAPIKQNGVTVTMSDLLKNNISDNLNLTACSFNNENSHTNLKADLGNKNVTKNIVKKKIYKNDNYCNDSGSSKWSKLNTSNRNAKTKHAYPKTKETTTSREKPCDQPLNDDAKTVNVEKDEKIEKKISLEMPSTSLTYAQMMVPTKATASIEVKMAADTSETKFIQDSSKVQKSPSKGKLPQNLSSSSYGRRNNSIKKKPTKGNCVERIEKPIESVEWFTIGAKGKKHVASNDSQVTEIAFENESKEEKVNKIAEELQLDIKKDADLAMDIMDSLIVTEEKSTDDVIGKVSKKKRIPINSTKTKKKSGKDKVNKEQKRNRRDTFDIIEPNFEAKNSEQKSSDHIETEEFGQNDEMIELESNKDKITEIEQECVFDPNVFSVPCNLQMDSIKRSTSAGQSNNALRLSTGKSPRNLINQFDIYQTDYTTMENQQLKQEEEMVIKILQQLNKSFDGTPQKTDTTVMDIIEEIAQAEVNIHLTDDQENDARENSVERFAINAKPYQNVYASNHFLEHSFGDRNDKSDHVVISTDLSSSDQSYVEDDEDISDEHFNTYPVIATDLKENEMQHEMDLDANGNDEKPDIENDETLLNVEKLSESIECETYELQTNETEEVNNLNQIENNAENLFETVKIETEVETKQESENVFEETLVIATQDNFEIKQHELVESLSDVEHESKIDVKIEHVLVEEKINEIEIQVKEKSTHEFQPESQIQAFEKTENYELSTAIAKNTDDSTEIKAEDVTNESIKSISTELVETVDCKESIASDDQQNEQIANEQNESICDRIHENNGQILKPMVQIEIHPISDDESIEQKINGISDSDPEPISIETDTSSNEIDTASTVSCNQSIISNVSRLRIVDTQLLQQQKKLQQTFPITTAVSLWLNQAQKEKSPEPIFRVPDYRFFSAAAKYKKQDSQTSHSNSSIDLTEDTASITSDKFHINDDEEEDIMNFWESPTLQTPQSPTPPPIAYNSVYGSSINYANLLSNKTELLCNNIIDFDASNGKESDNEKLNRNKSGFNQNMANNAELTSGIDEKCYRPPPEVCCTIM